MGGLAFGGLWLASGHLSLEPFLSTWSSPIACPIPYFTEQLEAREGKGFSQVTQQVSSVPWTLLAFCSAALFDVEAPNGGQCLEGGGRS